MLYIMYIYISQMFHVRNIYSTYIHHKFKPNIGNIPHMEHMGML